MLARCAGDMPRDPEPPSIVATKSSEGRTREADAPTGYTASSLLELLRRK
jgi:hypothetical protein